MGHIQYILRDYKRSEVHYSQGIDTGDDKKRRDHSHRRLIKETVTDRVYKVPILGDIPFLSLLFKKKEKEIDTTDLLFFITVNIVSPESEEAAVAAK